TSTATSTHSLHDALPILIDFDLDQEFEKAIGDPQQALEDLDNFLVDLGFSSSNGNSTSDEIHRISERLLEDMEALGEKLTRKLRSEEHTSELQSRENIVC